MKLAPWWLAPLNLVVLAQARPYMTTFEGLGAALEPARGLPGALRAGIGTARHWLHRVGHGPVRTAGCRRVPSAYATVCLRGTHRTSEGGEGMTKRRVLVLFAQEWDRLALADPSVAERCEVIHAGFDLFRFPENLRLLTFDVRRWIDRLVRLARRRGVGAVISPHEQFGTLIAAEVARRLGLPGPDPRVILTAQHKYYARAAIARVVPGDHSALRHVSHRPRSRRAAAAALSLLRQAGQGDLLGARAAHRQPAGARRHLRLRPFERFIAERLVRPFDDLLEAYSGFEIDARHILAEELLDGIQVNVDGYADRGRFRILGTVDEVMYPGTMAFNRFEYPSSLPDSVQARMATVAETAMRAVGFDHGLFNVELCYQPRGDTIKVIEVNPRIASQFVTLYEWVDGIRLYDLMLDLALGEAPRCEPEQQPHAYAASFVFRRFDGRPRAAPAVTACSACGAPPMRA